MGRRSGGGSGMGSAARATGNFDPDYSDVGIVSRQLQQALNMSPSQIHASQFNEQDNVTAGVVLKDVAAGNFGLASTIAQQMLDRKPGSRLGWSYGISDKQAFVVAKAAIDHGMVPKDRAYSKSFHDSVAKSIKQKQAAKAAKYAAYSSSYKKSSTNVAVGARVYDAKKGWGTIGKVLTKSTGYVQVSFDNGTTGKAMAFNLTGADGNPLKKRPK